MAAQRKISGILDVLSKYMYMYLVQLRRHVRIGCAILCGSAQPARMQQMWSKFVNPGNVRTQVSRAYRHALVIYVPVQKWRESSSSI
jgi:hypothetical protein